MAHRIVVDGSGEEDGLAAGINIHEEELDPAQMLGEGENETVEAEVTGLHIDPGLLEDLVSRTAKAAAVETANTLKDTFTAQIQIVMTQFDGKLNQRDVAHRAETEAKIQALENKIVPLLGGLTPRSTTSVGSAPSLASFGGIPMSSNAHGVPPIPNLGGFPTCTGPAFAEIKGWVTEWSKRAVQALTTEQALEWLKKLEAQMHPKLKEIVDRSETERSLQQFYVTRIYIYFVTGTPNCRIKEFKGCVIELLARLKTTLSINGIVPKVVLEASPEEKPRRHAGGRFYGALKDAGIPEDKFKVDWSFRPGLHAFLLGVPGRVPLADWMPESGWLMHPEALAQISEVNPYVLQANLAF